MREIALLMRAQRAEGDDACLICCVWSMSYSVNEKCSLSWITRTGAAPSSDESKREVHQPRRPKRARTCTVPLANGEMPTMNSRKLICAEHTGRGDWGRVVRVLSLPRARARCARGGRRAGMGHLVIAHLVKHGEQTIQDLLVALLDADVRQRFLELVPRDGVRVALRLRELHKLRLRATRASESRSRARAALRWM